MDFVGPKSIRAAEYLADIEGRLEIVEDEDEAVNTRCRQPVGIFLSPEALLGGDALLVELAAKFSQSHLTLVAWQFTPGKTCGGFC